MASFASIDSLTSLTSFDAFASFDNFASLESFGDFASFGSFTSFASFVDVPSPLGALLASVAFASLSFDPSTLDESAFSNLSELSFTAVEFFELSFVSEPESDFSLAPSAFSRFSASIFSRSFFWSGYSGLW